jgi:enoyl-CoA hydratase/carnithine racemase
MELKVIRYEIADNGVATVWLHRPGRGNSLSGRMNADSAESWRLWTTTRPYALSC